MIRSCLDRRVIRPAPPPWAEEMAAETAELWEPGTFLRIEFAGGLKADRIEVMHAAAIWEEHANIHFEQVWGGPSEARIGFNPGGSWHYVGRDCLSIPQDQPTGNMGWRGDLARSIHELGHLLGLIHEHQSPAAGIPWNRPAAYAYYEETQGWTAAEVDQQVFARYAASTITNTEWDKYSIMEYPIPAGLLLDPSYAVGWNQTLSPVDIATIGKLYPKHRWPGTGNSLGLRYRTT